MIVEGILNVLISGLSVVINFLTPFSLPFDLGSTLSQLAAWIGWANYYVPMEDVFTGFTIVFGVWTVCSVYSVFLQLL